MVHNLYSVQFLSWQIKENNFFQYLFVIFWEDDKNQCAKGICDWTNWEKEASFTFLTGFSMKTSETVTHTRSNANTPVHTIRLTDCWE